MKRLPILLLCICGLLFAGKASCQNSIISGKVNDQDENALNAAIVALKKSDSTLVKVLLTGSDGAYKFENIPEGKYFVEVSKPGHRPLTRKFEVEEGEQKEIKTFLLEPSLKNSIEQNPLLVTMPGKLVLDIAGSGAKIKGTAWDVMKIIPDVSENEDGMLLVNGKTKFQVEFDGKNPELTGTALRNRIKQIKAEQVSGIEVEEGSPVTINIITCEGARNGFYGKVTGSAEYGKNFRTTDAFEFNMHQGKFDFYGKYNFSDKKNSEQTFLQETFLYDGTAINFNSQSIAIQKPVDHEATIGVEYAGDKGLNFGAEFTKENLRDAGTQQDKSDYTFTNPDTTLSFRQSYTSLTNDKIRSMNFHADKTFKSTGTKFSALFSVVEDHNSWNQAFPVEMQDRDQTVNFFRFSGGSDLTITRATFKYAQAWNSKLVTVAGIKKTISTNKSSFGVEKLVNDEWMNPGVMNESYNSHQEINSAFVIGYLDFGKIEIAAAVDAQQSTLKGMSASSETIAHKSNVQFIPSLSIDHQLNKNNAINYSFSQDIKRPSFRDLDPTSRYVNRYTYSVGNPDLRPQITNEAKVTWTFLGIFSVAGGFDFTNNGIQQVSRVDSNGTIFRTKENITKEKNMTLEIFCPIPVGKHIIIQNQMVFTRSAYQSEVYGMSINSINRHFTGVTAVQIELPHNFQVNLSGYFVSPTTNGIVTTKAVGAMNASVSKLMLNKKLGIEIGVTDILNTGQTTATILTQDGLVNYRSKAETQTLTLKASYFFGNEKAARKD